jgi:uncharacterized membrane protein YdbT with pleckstrin-like domain
VGLPKGHLYNDEEIVIDLHPHWWLLTPASAGLVVAMVFGGWTLAISGDPATWWQTTLKVAAAIAVAYFLVLVVVRLVQWRTTDFVVTTERCIYRSGVFRKQGIEIPLDRINTVFFNQTVFERLIRAGDIGIESAGEGSRQNFSNIYNPNAVQNEIYRQMEANERRKSEQLGAAVSQHARSEASVADEIAKLHDLLERGAISQEEFESQKARLLGGT